SPTRRSSDLARLPAARPDRGADVGQVDAAPALDLPSHPVEPAEAGEAGPAELLREETLQPAPDARLALGEADDRARDVDRHAEAQVGQLGRAARPQPGQVPLGDVGHQPPVVLVNPARREVARGLPPVLAVLGAVAVENGTPDLRGRLLHGLDA